MASSRKEMKNIYYAIPGVGSLLLLVAALAVADIQLFSASLALGIGFAVSVPLFFLPVFYWYCRRCPHAADGTCRHVLIGRATKALFKLHPPARYSAREIILSLAPLAVLVLFPQYWLFRSIWPGVVFWALMAAAFLIVRIGVCPVCGNENCALCPKAK
jgi:hypothetical protein